MGQITTGVGLVSGLPTGQIIDQLMALAAKPETLIKQKIATLQSQETAFQSISAKLLALKMSADGLALPTSFSNTQSASSNESVLTVTSTAGAAPGSYNFTVHQLVSAQQTITRGFADTNGTAIAPGIPDGETRTLTFERGDARLDTTTQLSQLNGGQGIARGKIRITDRSGASAVVDLSAAATLDDVLKQINTSGVNVHAQVDGNSLKLTDLTGQTASDLTVADIGTSGTAASLGLLGSSATNELQGTQINILGRDTALTSLNDGSGVGNKDGVTDFRITTGATNYDIDLDGAVTLGDVMDKINQTTGGTVTASVSPDGLGIQLTGPAGFSVAALNSSTAADDLGITGTAAGTTLGGQHLLASMGSKLLRNLNGGSGVGTGTISITNRLGVATQVDLSAASSVSDVIDAINDAGAGVTASLNDSGNGLLLTDNTGGTNALTISDVSGTAAADLKLAGSFNQASMDTGNLDFRYITSNTRLDDLNVARGKFRITDSSGVSAVVDLTQGDENTISDVLQEINSRGLAINARINDAGDGIVIEDTGPGTVALSVEDDGSTTAADLGIAGEADAPGDDINGSFEHTVEIDNDDTLQDVADKINEAGVGVSATIISDGSPASPFRLSLTADHAGSGGAFVFDDGGLGLDSTDLVKAQDAVVFYGSADPAKALQVTSSSNTLDSIIPGATIQLHSVSDQPVQATISHDDQPSIDAVKAFVDAFNAVTQNLDSVDSYDADTQQRGVLLGDATVATIRSQLFSVVSGRDNDLTGQYTSLAQVGITVGADSQLQFDADKFTQALKDNPDAVSALFTFKDTTTDAEGNETVTGSGIGVKISDLLKKLTDGKTGIVQSRVDAIEKQIDAKNDRIADMEDRLATKRANLQAQFNAMEETLAKMKSQSGALGQLSALAAKAQASTSS